MMPIQNRQMEILSVMIGAKWAMIYKNPFENMPPANRNGTPINAQPHNPQPNHQVVVTTEEYEGLIPHPRLMREWNDIVPGSAERIFTRFETQSDHRMAMESRVIRANNFKQIAGPIFGFVVAMTALLGGIYTALQGHPFLGGTLSFAGLALLVGAFITNTVEKSARRASSKGPTNRQTSQRS